MLFLRCYGYVQFITIEPYFNKKFCIYAKNAEMKKVERVRKLDMGVNYDNVIAP